MQAPKDGDSAVLGTFQGQDRGEPAETFVTRSCGADALSDAFRRGFAEGLAPLSMAHVRMAQRVNDDVSVWRLGDASVRVSGLELVQCASPELLGRAKGAELHKRFHEAHPDVDTGCGSEASPGAPDTVPVPQVLAWSGGGSPEGLYGRVTIGIEGREVAYVPETTRGNDIKPEQPVPAGMEAFDAWWRNPYTAVCVRQISALQRAVAEVDGDLSHVLHELAGVVSLCWEPKPAGVFDSEQALFHVERAIERLRSVLRVNI